MSLYATLFTDLLMAALQAATVRVQAAEPLVPEAERQDAWHWLSYALQQPALWPQTRALVLALAPKMEQAGHRQDWLGYLQTAYTLAQQQADQAAQAELAYQIGLLYRLLTHYDEAMRWLHTGLTTFQQLDERRGQAQVLNEMAWVEQLRRRYDEATTYVEEAVVLSDLNSHELGMSNRVLGMIASYRGEWQHAETHHRVALALFEQNRDTRKVAWSMVNLAITLRSQKKFEDAEKNCIQAAIIMKQLNDDHYWTIAAMNLGLTHYFSGAIDKAVHIYLEVEPLLVHFHDKLRLADLYVNLALAYLANECYQKASEAFRWSIPLYVELRIQSQVVNAMDGLAISYIARRQFDEAVVVLEEALSMLPKIINAPNYNYYQQSLIEHMRQAKSGQELSFVVRTDVN